MKPMTPDRYHVLLRLDFNAFIRRCFHQLYPTTEYLPNWHTQFLAGKLKDCRNGKIRRLNINLPPRSLKSLCTSVALPAFLLGHNPSVPIICASYAQDLANKLSNDCRAIMESEWYRRTFPVTQLSSRKNTESEFVTTAGGFRLATSVGGVLTGRGADFIIIDDPQKPEEALSDAQRKAVNSWYDATLYTRQNNKERCCIVVIMQRLHENDLVGHVHEQERWNDVIFSAIAEQDETYLIETPYRKITYTRRTGEALHPERESLTTLAGIRKTVGEYHFACQYQQSPVPLGGGMVKKEWLLFYEPEQLPKEFEYIVQSWDTANKASELSDYSVCITCGVRDKKIYVLNVFRKRLNYPDLKRAVQEQLKTYKPSTILVEDMASGVPLIQELVNEGTYAVKKYSPEGDKEMRMNVQTAIIENGFFYLPKHAHWLAEYIHELMTFPKSKYKDQVDATSQVLDYIKKDSEVPALIRYYQQLAIKEGRNPHLIDNC